MIDVRNYGAIPDGVTDCATAINNALSAGDPDIIIQNGVFSLESSIKIPSNRTVYIKNAKIQLSSTAYDNIFRNSDFINGNTNISIIGQGNACINQNPAGKETDNSTYQKRGTYSYKYVAITLYKVTTFTIQNIHILDHLRHSVHLNQCSYGTITNYTTNVVQGSLNPDGIDIHWGCHHITINGMKGWTKDDFFDFICGNLTDYAVNFNTGDPMAGDIHDITVNNVDVKDSWAGRCPAIITGYGNKMYNITFTNIKLRKSGALFFNNYTNFYTPPYVAPSKDDIHDFIFDNCEINSLIVNDDAAFIFGQSIKNFAATNITNNSGKALYQLVAGDQTDNVKINGSQVV